MRTDEALSGAHVLVVDDEPLARRSLEGILGEMALFRAISSCSNGLQAVERITATSPDLVLLDVQMPGIDGLEVVRRVGVASMPPVVFVTAHDAHALHAFELAAVDYVLKPYSERRVRAAVERALERSIERGATRALGRLIAGLEAFGPTATASHVAGALAGGGFLRRILATVGRRAVVIPVEDILCLKADDYCATVVTPTIHAVIRESLAELEANLDPAEFVRVHRSAIVRIGAVREIRRTSRGVELLLVDGSSLPVARSRTRQVSMALGGAR